MRYRYPRGALAQIIILAFLAVSCSFDKPEIQRINPKIGEAGSMLSIRGEHFGETQGESFVSFSGVVPTRPSYKLWQDNLIVVRVPDFAESGLLYVHRDNKKSNPALFSMFDDMPVLPAPVSRIGPHIENLEPMEASIGSIISIKGKSFGSKSTGGAVLFSWDADVSAVLSGSGGGDALLKVESGSPECLSWTESEIRVRVPDGAATGPLQLSIQKADSNKTTLVVTGKPGQKIIKEKKTFAFSYSANVRVTTAQTPNSLFITLPLPAETAFQRNRGLIEQNIPPFAGNYRGTAVYKLQDLPSGASKDVSVSYRVDSYAIETKLMDIPLIKPARDKSGKSRWTESSLFIDSKSDAVRELAKSIIGRETNPYLKALAIFRAVLKDSSERNGFDNAKLFCALCRAAGIPAVPVAGVLVVHNKIAVPHLWDMFWIDGFGWIPVDIALAKGFAPEGFNLNTSENYYFGNIDANRIVFSFGETILAPLLYGGRTASRDAEYALQNIWEESSSGLESYSTLWSDIEITGVY